MDLSLSRRPRGTVPFSRRQSPFAYAASLSPRKLGQSPVNGYELYFLSRTQVYRKSLYSLRFRVRRLRRRQAIWRRHYMEIAIGANGDSRGQSKRIGPSGCCRPAALSRRIRVVCGRLERPRAVCGYLQQQPFFAVFFFAAGAGFFFSTAFLATFFVATVKPPKGSRPGGPFGESTHR